MWPALLPALHLLLLFICHRKIFSRSENERHTTTTRYCSRKQYGWLWAHEPNICYSMGTTTTTTHHRISDERPTCNRRGKIDLKFWVREWMLKTFAFSSVLAFFGYLHITTNYYTTQHSFLLNKFEFILPLLLNTIYIIYICCIYIYLWIADDFQFSIEPRRDWMFSKFWKLHSIFLTL